MPSFAALEALIEAAKSVVEDGANDAALGKIVAEALEGGHAGPDIDALLNALPGNNGADPASAFRASAAEAAVPGWDSGHFPALSHSAIISMEAAALHHDAVQPA